jgi:hypothetical protein
MRSSVNGLAPPTKTVGSCSSLIHPIRKSRFPTRKLISFKINYHFSTPEDLRNFENDLGSESSTLYLVDFELRGRDETGLDLIEELGIQKQSILVTSRFEDASVRARCQRLELRLIPKRLAGFVPIALSASSKTPDLVLIDDDRLVHAMWKSSAKRTGKDFRMYRDPARAVADIESIDRSVPIYVDLHLASNESGLTVAEKVHQKGFQTIYITTGDRPEGVPKLPFLAGVIGKMCPIRI